MPWRWALFAAAVALSRGLPTAAYQQLPPPQQCPQAHYDDSRNRFQVEPVTERVREQLELRSIVLGRPPCGGPRVDGTGMFSFQAVHYLPNMTYWRAVFPELQTLDRHGNRAGDMVPLYEACVVSTGNCVARFAPPPRASILEEVGLWSNLPRKLTRYINLTVSVMACLFVAYLALAIAGFFAAPIIVRNVFTSGGDSDFSDSEAEAEYLKKRYLGGGIPSTSDVIVFLATELGCMFMGILTMLLVCVSFIFQRNLRNYEVVAMMAYPVVIVTAHLCDALRWALRMSLYNALLRDRVHLIFDQGSHLWYQPLWVIVVGSTLIYFYISVAALVSDTTYDDCSLTVDTIVTTNGASTCSLSYVVRQLALKVWSVVFPAAYCIYLIFRVDQCTNSLVPLYMLFIGPLKREESSRDVPRFLGCLQPVAQDDFIRAGQLLSIQRGTHNLTACAVAAECQRRGSPRRPLSPHRGPFADVAGKGPRWWIQVSSLWVWRLRLMHSENKARELRVVLIIAVTAICSVLLMTLAALLYVLSLQPRILTMYPTVGQLSPPFQPGVLDYNLFVDHLATHGQLEVVSDKELVASTMFNGQTWVEAKRSLHVPLLVKNPAAATQSEGVVIEDGGEDVGGWLEASRQAAVPLEIMVHGANTEITYRITVVKIETRLASLRYSYNTSSEVDEVFIDKTLDASTVATGSADDGEMGSTDANGVEIYVPEDATTVSVEFDRKLAIYGPSNGGIVSGPELTYFEAAGRLVLCPEHGECNRVVGAVRQQLDSSVTGLPIQLQPKGGDPLTFLVNIIRVSNTLTNLQLSQSHGTEDGLSAGWTGLALLPAFTPLTSNYQVFFNIPQSAALASTTLANEAQWETMFFRVNPQGDARVNWLQVQLHRESSSLNATDVQLFCRPADDADQPLLPNVADAQEDLSCGASAQEEEESMSGSPTGQLISRAMPRGASFRGHFFVRYRFHAGDFSAFSLKLRVMYHQHTLVGSMSGASLISQAYDVKFLPHGAERLDLFTTAQLPRRGSFGSGRVRDLDEVDLPVFLSQPFHPAVLTYNATVPRREFLVVQFANRQSFWASSGNAPLDTPGFGAAMRQRVTLRRGSECGSSSVTSGSTSLMQSTSLCPLHVRAYQERAGYPRLYTVHLREASSDEVLFLGMQRGNGEVLMSLPGFRPQVSRIVSSLHNLAWKWFRSEAPAPAPGLQDLEPVYEGTTELAMEGPAPAPAHAAIEPTWTQEPLPSGSLAVSVASTAPTVNIQWNGVNLPISRAGGTWWHANLIGKALAEACWCDHEHTAGTGCRTQLVLQAPRAAAHFMRPNRCRLAVLVGNVLKHEVAVGRPWSGDTMSAVDAGALEAAYDATVHDGLAQQSRPPHVKRPSHISLLEPM